MVDFLLPFIAVCRADLTLSVIVTGYRRDTTVRAPGNFMTSGAIQCQICAGFNGKYRDGWWN